MSQQQNPQSQRAKSFVVEESERAANSRDKIEQIALELFARMPMTHGFVTEHQAQIAFARAVAFCETAAKVARGELRPGEHQSEDVLSDVCAPNLPDSHPLNMISRARGSIAKREELLNRLRNPKSHHMSLTDDDPGRNIRYLESILGVSTESLN